MDKFIKRFTVALTMVALLVSSCKDLDELNICLLYTSNISEVAGAGPELNKGYWQIQPFAPLDANGEMCIRDSG